MKSMNKRLRHDFLNDKNNEIKGAKALRDIPVMYYRHSKGYNDFKMKNGFFLGQVFY